DRAWQQGQRRSRFAQFQPRDEILHVVEDALGLRQAVAQGFEVDLDAGDHVGEALGLGQVAVQRVQRTAAYVFDELLDQIGRAFAFQHREAGADFTQQAAGLRQRGGFAALEVVVDRGLEQRDVDEGFADQRGHALAQVLRRRNRRFDVRV